MHEPLTLTRREVLASATDPNLARGTSDTTSDKTDTTDTHRKACAC